ncbi:MAG: type IV pilus assembly protein PilM [Firmicutes bacterium]|nr:type IV pilus assembly protein PilM [Bacillota bacterium]
MVVALFAFTALLIGLALGLLAVAPDLTTLIPGPAGERLGRIAQAERLILDRLVVDGGPLGGLRVVLEPYLSRVGVDLQTLVVAALLVVFASLCVGALLVVSRVGPEPEEVAGEETPSAGWPYAELPGSQPVPFGAAEAGVFGGAGPVPEAGGVGLGGPGGPGVPGPLGEVELQAATTGDAWPLLGAAGRLSSARPGGSAAALPTPPGPAGVGMEGPGHPAPSSEALAELRRLSVPSVPFESSPLRRLSVPAGAQVVAGEDGTAAGGFQAAATALSRPVSTPPHGLGEGVAGVPAAGHAALPAGSFGGGEDYLEDMPPPPYARPSTPPASPGAAPAPLPTMPAAGGPYPSRPYPQAPEPLRPMPGASSAAGPSVGVGQAAIPPLPPLAAPAPEAAPPGLGSFPPLSGRRQPQEAWVEVRPGLGTGLRRFIVPGLALATLGAGGAYWLTTPLATFITAGPYGDYLLASMGVVVSMATALWFSSGPMGPKARRVPVDVPAAQRGTFGGGVPDEAPAGPYGSRAFGEPRSAATPRRVAPAPIPARAALEGGLEAPDAVDWSRLPKPSVFLPGTQAATTVGIDIGSAWIKVAQVRVGNRGLELFNLALIPTPEGSVSEAGISDPVTLGEVLRDLLAGRNIVQRQVTTALGGQGVIIRHVQFPQMSEAELREVLRWEAEHHIPIPPGDAVVDFTLMPGQGELDERGARQMRVMLVGTQKKVVEAHVQALKRAKLLPKGIDHELLAAFRVVQQAGRFVEDPSRYAQAVVDFGHTSTKLGIFLKGALEMSRTLGIGGRTFTSLLCDRLQVPEVEAETLKRQYGVHPQGGRVSQALLPGLQDLMFEIRRSFDFFSSRHFGQSVRYVYLVGGGARMPGLAYTLARYLNQALDERVPEGAECRVETIDPLSAVPLSPRLQECAGHIGPEFITALGLALAEEEGGAPVEG